MKFSIYHSKVRKYLPKSQYKREIISLAKNHSYSRMTSGQSNFQNEHKVTALNRLLDAACGDMYIAPTLLEVRMSEQPTQSNMSRRKMLTGIGTGGIALVQYTRTLAQETAMQTTENICLTRYSTVQAMKSQPRAGDNSFAETAGFYAPGDGGAAVYRIRKRGGEVQPNDADVIALQNGMAAVLVEKRAVNYAMFGAVGDGVQDDGVPIKRAHEYANKRGVPIVNRTGEYWIKQTNDIPIATDVHWGKTTFHIDEKYNDKNKARFVVRNDEARKDLTQDEALKAALLEKIKPGVQLIPELAPYAGHLITVEDSQDRIGIRAGNYSKAGWAREEFFYVEEEGRVIGDIAWAFKNFTSVTATPCNDHYLVIEGGGFYFSGDIPGEEYTGYYHHGIAIHRSRVIIRQQWMGLEKGKRDISMQPRRGFYVLSGVYDVTLENIRAMPWEKNRRTADRVLAAGTYGISGARMLNCTFRNLTAEGGWVAWGFFGTNLNKNFRVENCRLNRIDVHFHCWNLYIGHCAIGFKGISITGGGDLVIENTTRYGNQFVNFRRDYGAKWDGHIHLRNCTLKPSGKGKASVLAYHPDNFDYQYAIGFARSVKIEDMIVDYIAAPNSKDPCWLMDIVPFSKTHENARLFFPRRIEFRNIAVEGRGQGVRLIRMPSPHHYDLRQKSTYDGNRLIANCTLICADVQLEKLTPKNPADPEDMHLLIGGETALGYADSHALCPNIRFTDCENIGIYFGHCIASAFFERCGINAVHAPGLRGELVFDTCRFQPDVQRVPEIFYTVKSSLGTRFTNCTLHAPIVGGKARPELIDRTGIVEIDKAVQHHHLNTALGNDIVNHFKTFDPKFIAKLMARHELENE